MVNIQLFVHGVPMGQKNWGAEGEDIRYINGFYGPKWQAKELMQVEVMNLSGKPFAYYTFIKGQNVLAYDGRAGSYFALTVRMDYYYADLKNMYNILSAAYNKMCVGKILTEQGDSIKYLVQGFSTLDAELQNIETQVTKYIGEFSNQSDLVSLAGFKCNGQQLVKNENLLECVNSKAVTVVKTTGKISVSPYYPSHEMEQFISKKDAEYRSLQQQTSRQMDEVRQQASQQVNDARQQINLQRQQNEEQLNQLRKESDDNVNRIRSQYAETNRTISALRQKVQDQEAQMNRLQKECSRMSQQLQQKDNEILRLRQGNEGGYSTPQEGRSVVDKAIPFVNLLFVLLLGGAAIFLMPKDNTKAIDQLSMDVAELQDEINKQNEDSVTAVSHNENVTSNAQEASGTPSTTPATSQNSQKANPNE